MSHPTTEYDLTHAVPVDFVHQIRKGDLRVFVTDNGIFVTPITEVVRTGKMVTVTAENRDNPGGMNVRFAKTTHRASTKTASALGYVYRPFGNLDR